MNCDLPQGGVSPLFYLEEIMESLLPATPPPSYPESVPAPVPDPVTTDLLKLCKMEKTSTGYGFHLNGIQGVFGQYVKEVTTMNRAPTYSTSPKFVE
jgi:hypothetical protein